MMHWLGSAVCRRAGCDGKAPDAPDCIKEKASPAKKATTPPLTVQSLLERAEAAMPEAETAPMADEEAEPELETSEKLKEVEQLTQRLAKLGVAPGAELKALEKSLKTEGATAKDPPRVVFQQASQYEERMSKELEKAQKQRMRAEEELARLKAKEQEADAKHQRAKAAKAIALSDLNTAEALETPPGLPAVQAAAGQGDPVTSPADFLAAAWILAQKAGAPKGDYATYSQEMIAKGDAPVSEATWQAQAMTELLKQLVAGDGLSTTSASANAGQGAANRGAGGQAVTAAGRPEKDKGKKRQDSKSRSRSPR